jgi:hypothetical protein
VTVVVIRFLFALLLGFVLGCGTLLYLIHSGAGDFLVRRTEPVQDMERRLREAELQRDQLGRQLGDVASRATRMESAFADMERRFKDLERERDTRAGAERPGE